MSFFRKNKNHSDPQMDDAIKEKMHELGFEVGYFGHSREGWVLKKYKEILDLASAGGIDDDIDDYYQKGKIEGKEQRRTDISNGLSAKNDHSTQKEEKITVGSIEPKKKQEKKILDKQPSKPIESSPVNSPQLNDEPELNSKPKVLNKSKAMDMPGLLK